MIAAVLPSILLSAISCDWRNAGNPSLITQSLRPAVRQLQTTNRLAQQGGKMNIKNLFTIHAIISLLFGLGMLLVPATLLS